MSCKLYWKPVLTESYRVGDINLREILNKKYNLPAELDYSDIAYLQALNDAGIEGAKDLADSIYKFNRIQIFLEC
jgi:hypothetical protein